MRLDFKFDIKIKDREVLEKLKGVLEKSMLRMEEHAVRLVPVDTGTLRNSIHLVKKDDFNWELRDGVEYGVHVEYGTSPHVIMPKVVSALKFKRGGKVVFARRVRHPGTSGQPFFRPALDIVKTTDFPRIVSESF